MSIRILFIILIAEACFSPQKHPTYEGTEKENPDHSQDSSHQEINDQHSILLTRAAVYNGSEKENFRLGDLLQNLSGSWAIDFTHEKSRNGQQGLTFEMPHEIFVRDEAAN